MNRNTSTGRASSQIQSLPLPEKVTLAWMMSHVPVSFWIWAAGIVIASFSLGVATGQTSFIRELFGRDKPATAGKSNSESDSRSVASNSSPTPTATEPEKALPPLSLSFFEIDPKDQNESRLKTFRESRGLRPLAPLETGKKAREVPSGTFFFISSNSFSGLSFVRRTPQEEVANSDANGRKAYYYLEVQKPAEDQFQMIAFVSSDVAQSISRLDGKSRKELVLFPIPWEGHHTLVTIPVERLMEIRRREISTENSTSYVLDAVIR